MRKLTLLGGGRYLPIDSPDSIGSLFLSLEYPLLIVWYSEAGISACHEKTKTKFVNEMLFDLILQYSLSKPLTGESF